VILVDTSAWVEYLRGTGSREHHALRALLAEGAPLATTDVVIMELLAGAKHEAHAATLRRMLAALEPVPVQGPDFEEAPRIHRRCRAAGESVRALTDCLIAAVAVRVRMRVLARDRDFEVLARHAGLALER
jgi:predicted nucleic acid-binding protein